MIITGLDHIVLTVASIDASCEFYVGVLGMSRESLGDDRTAVHFGTCKINLHEFGQEPEPKAFVPTPGSADLCFIVTDLDKAVEHLELHGITLELGPISRSGALGEMVSVYVRDPDLNLIEFAQYG